MSNLALGAYLWFSKEWFFNILVTLFLSLDWVVYIFINWVYRVFMLVAKVNIFEDGTQIEAITQRLYIIVGVAMLFIFAYNLILLIVNPEGNQLGNMGKVIQRAIISIILVTFLPLIFRYLTIIQNDILDSNVIAKVILGSQSDESDNTNKSAGVETSLIIFSAFYHPVDNSYFSCSTDANAPSICSTYVTVYDEAIKNQSISSFIWDGDLKNGVIDGDMEYNWIISTIAGGIALWLFVSFALDIGKRVAQIAFYQIISPIPVMMRIMPGDKMFDKWFNGLKNTYLSLFLRLAIIYFAMYAVGLVPDIFKNMWADGQIDNAVIMVLADVIIILGILMFAKQAPKLLSDIFGSASGELKFGIRDKLRDNPINKPIGMLRSGVYAHYNNQVEGEQGETIKTGGFLRGMWRGRHGYESGVARTDQINELKQSPASLGDVIKDKVRVAIGRGTEFSDLEKNEKKEKDAQRFEERREHNKKALDSLEKINDTINKILEKETSDYKSDAGMVVNITDDAGNILHSYNLANMNLTDMNTYVQRMIDEGADVRDIGQVRSAIESWKKQQNSALKTEILERGVGGLAASVTGTQKHDIEYAVEDLRAQLAEGVAESVINGELVSDLGDAVIENADDFKLIKDTIEAKDREMSLKEREISSRYDKYSYKYRAKKASSEYVKNSQSSSGGGKDKK